MKKIILILITALALTLISCSDNSKDDDVPAVGTVKMTLDGSSWQASGANAVLSTMGNNQQLSIAGAKVVDLATNTFETVTITIISNSAITAGDYIWKSGLPYAQVTFSPTTSAQNTWSPGSAEITITKITDDNVQGTFSATLEKSGESNKVITSGGFNTNIMSF